MKKKHYFLVAGQVVFRTAEEEAGSILVNAIVTHDHRHFPVRMIGKAQQALQLNFYKQANDTTITIVDVPIQNVCYLGHMTEAQFNAVPEGMQLQEQPDTLSSVN